MRQTLTRDYDPRSGVSISSLAYDYPSGYRVDEHAHGSHQLIYAISGVMQVSSGQQVWMIPPHFGIWIPARTRHSIAMLGIVSMRTLYVRNDLAAKLPLACRVLHITALLRELIVETVRIGKLRKREAMHCALRDLLLWQLEHASPLQISVTVPRDRRAVEVAEAVLQNPGERRSLAELCTCAGASVRTIQRLFLRELGSGFEFWRRQVRLMKAVELLVSGRSVKETAFALGYQQPTAFVEMFRETLGTTPGAWAQALRRLN